MMRHGNRSTRHSTFTNGRPFRSRPVWSVMLACVASLALCKGADSPVVEPSSLPSAGVHQVSLTIPQFGYYAVIARSDTGVALQLVDPMSGPGDISGEPGKQDGRIDRFLDTGTYRLTVTGHPDATGETELTVRPFDEPAENPIQELPEFDVQETVLGDFEIRSWWITVDSVSDLVVCAAGRALARMELWREGGWIEPSVHQQEASQPVPGHSLSVHFLYRKLSPGRYRLSLYAGAPLPWAVDSDAYPLYVRRGLLSIGDTGRISRIMSPIGVDLYSISGQSDYLRAELTERNRLNIDVQFQDPSELFGRTERTAEIVPESKLPFTEMRLTRTDNRRLILVRGGAGLRYTVQNFQIARQRYIGRGVHWLSSIRSGNPIDHLDQTMILIRTSPAFEVIETRAIPITDTAAWARRFNLTSEATLHLEIKTAGEYAIVSDGPETRFRIEPVFDTPPPNYSPPPFRASGYRYSLDAGYYLLTMQTEQSGVLKLAIGPPAMAEDALKTRLAADPPQEDPPQGGCVMAPIRITDSQQYRLMENSLPDELTGICFRSFPIDIDDSLSFFIQAGQTITVPNIRSKRDVTIRALAEDGTLLDIVGKDGSFAREFAMPAGETLLQVRNSGNQTTCVTLIAVRHDGDTDQAEGDFFESDLQALTTRNRVSFSGEPGETRSCVARIDEAGFYMIESTGLLAIEAALSSRTESGILGATKNGPGRNAVLLPYLREGDYLVSFRLTGGSRGSFGARLQQLDSIDAGRIAAGAVGRVAIPAHHAAAFGVAIPEKGAYRITADGLNQTFRLRIEDPDGWPITQPGTPGSLDLDLDPGDYIVRIMPLTVESKCLVSVDPIRKESILEGHGPHPLSLGVTARCRWMEPASGAAREPDVWTLHVPAKITATIRLSSEMQGELTCVSDPGHPSVTLPANRPWYGTIDAGDYRIAAVCSRSNNALDYEIRADSDELVDGVTLPVTEAGAFDVSIAHPAFAILRSSGTMDLKARLLDPDGVSVAAGDDLPDDWNFLLTARVEPGRYTLRIDKASLDPGSQSPRGDGAPDTRWSHSGQEYEGEGEESYDEESEDSQVENDPGAYFPVVAPIEPEPRRMITAGSVSMTVPEEILCAEVTSPYNGSVALTDDLTFFPVECAPDANVLVIRGESSNPFLITAVFQSPRGDSRQVWTSGKSCRLDVPFPDELPERKSSEPERPMVFVGVVSLVAGPGSAELGITAARIPEVSEADLTHGVSVYPVDCLDLSIGLTAVRCEHPGLFTVIDPSGAPNIRTSTGSARPCEPSPFSRFPVTGSMLWIASDIESGSPPPIIRCERLRIGAGSEGALRIGCAPGDFIQCDLDSTLKGPVILTAYAQDAVPGVSAASGSPFNADARAMSVGHSSAVTVALNGKGNRAVVWNADPGSRETIEATLQITPVRDPIRESFSAAPVTLSLSPGESRMLPLHETSGSLTVSVDDTAVAAYLVDDRPVHVLAGHGTMGLMTFDVDGGALFLANPGTSPAVASVVLYPTDPSSASFDVSETRSVERTFATRGNRCIRIVHPEPGTPRILHVQGADGEVLFQSEGGLIGTGSPLRIYDSGTCLVPHESGSIVVWLDGETGSDSALWPDVQTEIRKVVLPIALNLSGGAVAAEISIEELSALHLAVPCPAIVRLAHGETPEYHALPDGGIIDTLARPGNTQISIRALNDRQLSGSLEIAGSPAQTIREGPGDWKILQPGYSAAFSFEVSRTGAIGIGVLSAGGVVHCELFDADGERIGTGVVQMPELEPGTYSILVQASPDNGPVRIRPALAGLHEPPAQPPDDVIKNYLGMSKLEGTHP